MQVLWRRAESKATIKDRQQGFSQGHFPLLSAHISMHHQEPPLTLNYHNYCALQVYSKACMMPSFM